MHVYSVHIPKLLVVQQLFQLEDSTTNIFPTVAHLAVHYVHVYFSSYVS